jgi:hypothetical protein
MHLPSFYWDLTHRRTMEMGWFEMVDIPMYGNCERRNDDNAWDLGVIF